MSTVVVLMMHAHIVTSLQQLQQWPLDRLAFQSHTATKAPIPFSRSISLCISTRIDEGYSSNNKESSTSSSNNPELDMPWNEWQEWAVRDNLPKYTVMIGGVQYALWRSMVRDVTELAGYDVAFVRKIHQSKTSSTTTPRLLPLLDQFQFESQGGITGTAYGIAGIAQGATIQTPPLVHMEDTLPKGYVVCHANMDMDTDNNTAEQPLIAYELGMPKGEQQAIFDTTTQPQERYRMLSTLASVAASQTAEVGMRALSAVTDNELVENDNQNMIRLGGLTAMLLTGATVMNAFHHHLTVNVFWV